MATTAKGTPYVESSDLVADYPTVSLALAEHIDDFGGKVLQVVRATDTTDRTTTSGSYTDVTGMSVTITPKKNDSAVIILAVFNHTSTSTSSNSDMTARYRITDSSNNAISGAEDLFIVGSSTTFTGTATLGQSCTLVAYATPATLSAVTYKLRFHVAVITNTAAVKNALATGQMYAIEVSA